MERERAKKIFRGLENKILQAVGDVMRETEAVPNGIADGLMWADTEGETRRHLVIFQDPNEFVDDHQEIPVCDRFLITITPIDKNYKGTLPPTL